jgi:hypothetical protein
MGGHEKAPIPASRPLSGNLSAAGRQMRRSRSMKALKAFHEKRESRREERLRREEAAAPMLYPAPELPDAPVENVRFSTRIRNALSAAGMKTIGEAREASDDRPRSLRTLATARSPIFLKTPGLPSTDGVRPLGKKPA